MERETPTVPDTSTQIDVTLAVVGVVSGIVAAMAMDAFSRGVRAPSGGTEAPGAASGGETQGRKTPPGQGSFAHYGLGAAMGINYMLASEQATDLRRGYGTLYGSLVWAAADEGALPAAGLSTKTGEIPLGVHARTLSAHWVYGATLETCRRIAAAILDAWERSGRVVEVAAEPVPVAPASDAAGTV